MSKKERLFQAAIYLYFVLLCVLSATTPITPAEAKILYSGTYSLSGYLAIASHSMIPGIFGYRIFSLLSGFVALLLFRELSRGYFRHEDDYRLSVIVYMLLPGVIASAVLINDGVFALLCTMIFVYAHERKMFFLQVLAMTVLLFTDTAAFSFYFALALYAYKKKKFPLFWFSLLLFIVSVCFGHFGFEGKPRGHLVELFGVYAALFSPLFFVYFFYAVYRVMLNGPRDLYWYLASVPFIVSLLLSIRQKILITDFGPYLLIGVLVSVSVFSGSLRVRMKSFQRPYRIAKNTVLFFLVLSGLVTVAHRPLYRVMGDPRAFFASALYEPYDLALKLRTENRRCFRSDEIRRGDKYLYVMRFYGFEKCR